MAAELNEGKVTSNPGGWRGRVTLSALRQNRRALIWIGAVSLVSLVALAAVGLHASSQPERCASCHEAQTAALAEDVHSSVTCYQCHLEAGPLSFAQFKADELFRMYPRTRPNGQLRNAGRRVSRKSCAQCHQGGPEGVTESKGLRIDHSTCAAPPRRCDECHNDAGHGAAVRWSREPVMDECITCHAQQEGPTKCDTCHDGRIERQRLSSGPWQITHGPQWKNTHGMGALETCASCHAPSKCISCHRTEIPHPGGFLRTHGKQALAKDAGCATCHQTKSWCTSCHGVPMPHPKGFLKEHATIAATRTDKRCQRCHAPEDCVNCHVAHTHPGRTDGDFGGSVLGSGTREQ